MYYSLSKQKAMRSRTGNERTLNVGVRMLKRRGEFGVDQ